MSTELSEVVGALVASVTRARMLADLQTAAAAEAYQDHPLLRGLTVPRVRLPEVAIELPLTIHDFTDAEPFQPLEAGVVVDTLVATLEKSVAEEGFELTDGQRSTFRRVLDRQLARLKLGADRGRAEALVRSVESALAAMLKVQPIKGLDKAGRAEIMSDLRHRARSLDEREPSPATVRASIITGDIKERGPAGAVARLRLIMREEGLEWSVDDGPDDTTRRFLVPE